MYTQIWSCWCQRGPLHVPTSYMLLGFMCSCSDVVDRELNPVLDGKRVVDFWKVVHTAALLSPVAELQ